MEGFRRGDVAAARKEQQGGDVASLVAKERNRGACKLLGWLLEPRASIRRHTGSYYPKRYWELLPKEILGATTQRDTRSYYPKRYLELLPKEILVAITQRDTVELLPKEILGMS
ncbi:hypothetical protein Tco_0655962 [Tanacetum coccineum]|uniref:Uncharacterized protein n=1 Tax=Tanacetum coccineum TaxID=301880 RepID=A0ABQ4X823_9ASTR